jgi:hypothetical protein
MNDRQSLPVLRDQNGQQIRENDILRVFWFHGRRRGKGRQKHYMYKIARVIEWPSHSGPPFITWAFFHTAAPPDGTLNNCYSPYQNGQFHSDQTLEGVEVIYSPETMRIEKKRVICKP